MRAKDYAKAYTALRKESPEMEPVEVMVRAVFIPLSIEMADLTRARNVQTESAALACFREIEQKYRAIAQYLTGPELAVAPDGWRIFLRITRPELWEAIQSMMLKERK